MRVLSKRLMPSLKWPGDQISLAWVRVEGQAIVISGSPEMGLNEQPASENITLAESREAFPALAEIQVVHPPE